MVEVSADGNGKVVTTFRLAPSVSARNACVVGEFNDWSETANPMQDDVDGFVAQIPLEPGRTYRFRYLLDGTRWENDWAADAYVPNEFGGDDSVVDLTGFASAAPSAAAPCAPAPTGTMRASKPKNARR